MPLLGGPPDDPPLGGPPDEAPLGGHLSSDLGGPLLGGPPDGLPPLGLEDFYLATTATVRTPPPLDGLEGFY